MKDKFLTTGRNVSLALKSEKFKNSIISTARVSGAFIINLSVSRSADSSLYTREPWTHP